MQCYGDRHHGIHNAFKNLSTIVTDDGRVGHVMTDIAHQHERATV